MIWINAMIYVVQPVFGGKQTRRQVITGGVLLHDNAAT